VTREEAEEIKRLFDEAMAPVQAELGRAVAIVERIRTKAKTHDLQSRPRPQPGDCGPDPSGSRNARG
jgi:hypothetical protein